MQQKEATRQSGRTGSLNASGGRMIWLRARLPTLDRADIVLLAEAWAWMLAARLALAWVPARWLLQGKARLVARGPARLGSHAAEIARMQWAVEVIVRRSPFALVCFPQCLAGAILLARRGVPSRLHFGIARGVLQRVGAAGTDPLRTHVWLEAGGSIVLGGELAPQFSLLATY